MTRAACLRRWSGSWLTAALGVACKRRSKVGVLDDPTQAQPEKDAATLETCTHGVADALAAFARLRV